MPARHILLLGLLLALPASWAAAVPPAGGDPLSLQFADGAPAVLDKVRLAGATRDAVRAAVAAPLVATTPPADGVFVVSIGAPGGVTGESLRFAVDVERDGRWHEIWSAALAAGASGWADHRLPLTAEKAPRRLRLRVAGDGAAFWGSPRFLPAHADSERPANVVLISLDTLGAQYLGSYGGLPEASRNIDRFLSGSYTFRRAYTTYPNTLVSHASLFNSRYPSTHGVYGSARDSAVSADSLATVLRARGYLNVAYTENAFVSSDFGFDRGFDWYDDGPESGEAFLGDAAETFGRARAWLEQFGDDAPFLLFVHTYEVHSPYILRNDDSRRIADAVFPAPAGVRKSLVESAADTEHLHNAGFVRLSADEVRRMRAVHVGEIHYLDQVFAEFIAALEEMPFADRTLVVLFADHGDEFDPHGLIGHGESLADAVMHVPLAFHLPDRFTGGEYRQPVSLVDVAPTILDFLGYADTLAGDGRSLLPLLDGAVDDLAPRPVFAELQRAAATCISQRLPETCFVGRFVVYAGAERFEYSMIPHYQELRQLPDGGPVRDAPAAAIEPFRILLAAYVTGAPWQSQVPWSPQAVDGAGAAQPLIDDVTRQRLEALGYNF